MRKSENKYKRKKERIILKEYLYTIYFNEIILSRLTFEMFVFIKKKYSPNASLWRYLIETGMRVIDRLTK